MCSVRLQRASGDHLADSSAPDRLLSPVADGLGSGPEFLFLLPEKRGMKVVDNGFPADQLVAAR
jgi:hypothetical protein